MFTELFVFFPVPGKKIQLLLGPSLELLSALAESPDKQPPAAAAAKNPWDSPGKSTGVGCHCPC